MSRQPYISIAFTNRNDGYGGDLERRIDRFIEYYGWYARQFPGLFEFVICDWNPPNGCPLLRDAFDWSPCGDVVHVVVPPEIHLRRYGNSARKMLDYIGRNVSIRRGSGEFTLVVNQDIFLSESLIRNIAQKQLSPRHFYRADRCDFNMEPCRGASIENFEAVALANVFRVHRRHRSGPDPISLPASIDTVTSLGSGLELGDFRDENSGIGYCRGATLIQRDDKVRQTRPSALRRLLLGRRRQSGETQRENEVWREQFQSDRYLRGFYLHTNASGDFILAPRTAFDAINGMPEATNFYMHLDAYAIAQFFAAGYEQAIFMQPHRVYHADHDRSSRADAKEGMTWPEHERELSRILRGDRPFQFNGPDWGLHNESLPTWRNGVAV